MLVAAVALGCAYVAAPALSSQQYMPGGVDFEQPLRVDRSAPAASSHGARRHRSASSPPSSPPPSTSTSPASRASGARTRSARATDGGEWSEWAEAEDGNPVYFGGADELQLRARGFRPQGNVHYVNVSGTTTARRAGC